MMNLAPFVVLVWAGILVTLSGAVPRLHSRLWPRAPEVVSACLSLFSLLFIVICNSALNMGFAIYKHPGGETSLRYFPYILKGTDQYALIQWCSIIGLILWCCGGIAFVIVLLYAMPKYAGSLPFQRAILAVTVRFQKEFPWWYVVVLLRSLLLTLSVTLFENGATQTAFMTVVLVWYSLTLVSYNPYFAPLAYYADLSYAVGNTVLLTFVQLYSLTGRGAGFLTAVTVLLYGTVGSIALYSFYIFANQKFRNRPTVLNEHMKNAGSHCLGYILPKTVEMDYLEAVRKCSSPISCPTPGGGNIPSEAAGKPEEGTVQKGDDSVQASVKNDGVRVRTTV